MRTNSRHITTISAALAIFAAFAPPSARGQNSPVQPISLGEAMKFSLDNYYDVLKARVGTLQSTELLQLQLNANPIEVYNPEGSTPAFTYKSHHNLLNISDVTIAPMPVGGMLASDKLHRVYGRFLRRLRSYIEQEELEPEDKAAVEDLQNHVDRLQAKKNELWDQEYLRWQRYCQIRGINPADTSEYLDWSGTSGNRLRIEETDREIVATEFRIFTILDQQWEEPEDEEVVQADVDFRHPRFRLRYPLYYDYDYPNYENFNLNYLASRPTGGDARWDDRHSLTWNKSFKFMNETTAGGFNISFDRTTASSESIKTDWNYSGSASYKFIKASASASDRREIEEEFKEVESLTLSANAVFSTEIVYPGWFKPELFNHPRVKENIRDFEDFFGPRGSLRFVPASLVMVRGFAVEFKNSQDWEYDYERKFQASAGGGFSVLGVGFKSSGSYSKHTKKHKVDQANTSLKFGDGDNTLRLVGYVVRRNTVWNDTVNGPDADIVEGGFVSPITEPGEDATATP